ADEPDFNRWYDREHLEERVAIEGFLEARRYVAHETSLKVNSIKVSPDSSVEEHLFTPQKALPQYLFLYSTKTIDVLDGPAYRARLNNPTEWSKKTMAKFKNMIRVVARITVSRGTGRGAVLGILRLRPQAGQESALRAALTERLDPAKLDGIISMHMIESDAKLSGPTTEIPAAGGAGASDWFVLVDGTSVNAVGAALAVHLSESAPADTLLVSSGVYQLLWDLAKSDIG